MNKEEITSAETKIMLSTEELHEIKTEYAKQHALAFVKHYSHGAANDDRLEERYEWWLKNGSDLGV